MTRRDSALILGIVAYVRQKLKAIEERAKSDADVAYPEERVSAAVGGVVVSNTTRVQPHSKLRVEDEVRFAEWVAERWPTEVVPHVADAFRGELLQRMLDHPLGILEDANGEVCMFVELDDPTPYTRTSLAKGGPDLIAPLLEGRSLADMLTAIEDEPTDLDRTA